MSRRSRRAATGPRYSVAVSVVVVGLGTALAAGAGVTTMANGFKGKATSLEQISKEEQAKADADRGARPGGAESGSGGDGSETKPGERDKPGDESKPGDKDTGGTKPGEKRKPGQETKPGKKPQPGTKPGAKPDVDQVAGPTTWPKTALQREQMRKDPKPFAKTQAAKRGWTGIQVQCLNNLWQKESGWKHNAKDAKTGAYGIAQALPAWRMKSAGKDWKTNPATQMVWGLDYIKDRHKSPCLAWEHHKKHGWY